MQYLLGLDNRKAAGDVDQDILICTAWRRLAQPPRPQLTIDVISRAPRQVEQEGAGQLREAILVG
jgi:hypothetical protein